MSTAIGVSKEHITKTPGVCGGTACVAGTRIRVIDVVVHHRAGMSPAEIATTFCTPISVADVYAALTYAEDFHEEIEATFRHEEEVAEKYGGMFPSKLMDKLGG